MTQGRLNHCMQLAIYKETTYKLGLINVADNEFCSGSVKHSVLLGDFRQNDLRSNVCTI